MPKYQIEIGGKKYEVEALDEATAISAIEEYSAQPQGKHLSFDEGQALLNKEQMEGPFGTVGAALTGALDGIPIAGPAILGGTERVGAAINSLSGGSYEDNLRQIQENRAGAQEAHPYVTTGANVAGGVAGTIPMIVAAPGAFGVGTGSLMGRMAMSGLSGSVIGGGDQAVRSGGDVGATAKGAGFGLLAGGAGPLIGKGVGSAIRYARGAASDALSGMSKGAQRFIEGEISTPAKLARNRAAIATLGPDATLADVSPEWLGVARGAAATSGSRDRIVNALNARSAGANARLGADMDANLGRAIIPSQVERGIEASQEAIARGYGPVMATARAVDTEPLASRLDSLMANVRGPEQQAVRNVRSYLNIPGTNTLDPNPQALLATRHTIDGMLSTEANPQIIRQLTIARQEVDDVLARAAPGIKEVDAQFSELARQKAALGQGRPILSNEASAIRPQELDEILAEGIQPQGLQVGPSAVPTRMRQGVRAEIDRAVGTKANDTTALRNIVRGDGDWNRTKLGQLFGQENADRALAAIDREAVFGDTANRVTRGSDTAMGSGFAKFLAETEKGGSVPADTTFVGAGLRTLQKIGEALVQKNASANASRYASEIGGLSVAQGAERDAIINALLSRASASGSANNPTLQAVINALTQSSAQQALR